MSAARVGRRAPRLAAAVAAAATLLVGLATPAAAHPLGNSSTNLHSGLRVEPDRLVVDHVVDLAEIRTVQLVSEADTDGDGALAPAEGDEHAAEACRSVAATATLTVDGQRVPLTPGDSSLRLAPGQGGLQVARLGCALTAPLRLDGTTLVEYRDDSYAGRFGWREVTAVGDGTTLVASDVPTVSPSARLTAYPEQGAGSRVPDERSASLQVRPGGPRLAADPVTLGVPAGVLPRGVDALTSSFLELVSRQQLTLGVGLLAVLLAVVLGSGHALAPGHGKTVMAAYLVGQEGSPRKAVLLGGIVTFTHTAGVLALGFLLLVSATLASERLLPVLEVASGALLATVGVFLLRRALARRRALAALAQSRKHHAHGHHAHHDHDHDHDHGHAHHDHAHHKHDHDHDHGQGHGHGHGHHDNDHAHHGHDHHGHDDDHGHDHGHRHAAAPVLPRQAGRGRGGLVVGTGTDVQTLTEPPPVPVPPGPTPEPGDAPRPGVAPGTSTRLVAVEHDHGLGRHTHLLPDPAKPLGARSLAAMGVAGGLVPSPSALVVLLGATALGRAWFGVLLVLAYGVGMALTLTLAGLLLLRAQGALSRSRWRRAGGVLSGGTAARALAALPALTATVIVGVGLLLVVRGLTLAVSLG